MTRYWPYYKEGPSIVGTERENYFIKKKPEQMVVDVIESVQ